MRERRPIFLVTVLEGDVPLDRLSNLDEPKGLTIETQAFVEVWHVN